MRTLSTLCLAAILASAATMSLSQPGPNRSPPGAPSAPNARPPGPESAPAGEANERDEARAVLQAKRQACRQAGTAQGLRGPGLADHVVVCVLEARLACVKQAIAQGIRGPARREFLGKCLAG